MVRWHPALSSQKALFLLLCFALVSGYEMTVLKNILENTGRVVRIIDVREYISVVSPPFPIVFINTANPVEPVLGHSLGSTESVIGVSVGPGDAQFLAAGTTGLVIFKLLPDTGEAQHVGQLELKKHEGTPTCVVSGPSGFAYLFTATPSVAAFTIVDIGDPSTPFAIGKTVLKGRVVDAVVDHEQHFLYAVTSNGYILTFDIASPSKFSLVSEFDTQSTITSVSRFLEYIYVAVGNDMRSYLVRLPKRVPIVEEGSRVTLGSTVNDVQWFGGHVFAATDTGLALIEVQDPRKPRLVSEYRHSPSAPATAVRVRGDLIAYLAVVGHGLVVLDAKRPPPTPPPQPVPSPLAEVKQEILDRDVILSKDLDNHTLTGAAYLSSDVQLRGSPVCGIAAERDAAVSFENRSLKPGMLGWGDLPHSQYTTIPAWQQGTTAFVPSGPVPEGSLLKVGCCHEHCDMILYLEHCLPCSSSTNGGLPSILLVAGWEPMPCGPSFTVGAEGVQYPTVSFFKSMSRGDSEVVGPLSQDARFFGFAVMPDGCTTRSYFACLLDFSCQWDSRHSSCARRRTCPAENNFKERLWRCFSCAHDELPRPNKYVRP